MHPMSKVTNFLFIIAITVVFAATAYDIFVRIQRDRIDQIVPFEVVHSELVNKRVRPGESIFLKATVNRPRECITQTHRFVFDSKRIIVHREINPAAATQIGVNFVNSEIRLPFLSPGTYTYEPIAYTTCEGRVYLFRSKPMEFEVINFNELGG